MPFSDFEAYLYNAYSLKFYGQYGHPEPTSFRLPGYPVFLFLLLLVKESIKWLSFWNVLLNALAPVLAYYLMLKLNLGDKKTASVAGLVCALNPTFLFFSTVCATEHLFILFLLFSFFIVHVQRLKASLRMALSGAILGLAILTRGEALFYLPVLILSVVLITKGRRQRLWLSAWCLAACILVLLPWYIRNVTIFGPGVGLSSSSGLNFYLGHNAKKYGHHTGPGETLRDGTPLEGVDEATMCRLGYQLGLEYIKEKPQRLLQNTAKGTSILYLKRDHYAIRSSLFVSERYSPTKMAFRKKYPVGSRPLLNAYYYSLLLLAPLSLVFYRRYPKSLWFILFGIIFMNWMCYAVVYSSQSRYSYTAEVVFCLLAGITLSHASRRIRQLIVRK
ncbi:MAG: glycosyltransferase family 39 protein [Candidatus Latescibacterota bacterium]